MTNKADYTKSKCFKEEIPSNCGKFGMSFTKEVGAGLDLGAWVGEASQAREQCGLTGGGVLRPRGGKGRLGPQGEGLSIPG